ncbi:hypothetical protein [Marinobacterium sedimentorum]|uniref:hypothetical protein n=1 Tax=Marinobacterium sedimentorum TaxID=2927804 RepID=UPI0020C655E7|nr:hypothetical protein [Marinobacterium sedimentorum]MCP8687065.1 hypothetical protein [Marinobacterium sedimentorum]
MQIKEQIRKIAVLDVDGESFEVDGHYRGHARKASWYTVIRVSTRKVHADHLASFPSCDKIRSLIH